MSITVVEAPQRTSGRRPRLSDEDVQDLANAVKEGRWASDDEVTVTKSAAYQRAQSAAKLVGDRYKVIAKTSVIVVDGGFKWSIGPRPEGEQPRGRRSAAAQSA